jgi:ParB-like chromosome segregation protein Spo0J
VSAVATEDRLRVQFAPVEELIPYARNARKHTPEQVAELMGSMQEWGWTNPVLADGNGIVAGHGRVLAAARLYELGKTIKLPSGDLLPAGMVPFINCSGWSAAQRQAYVIADNKLALNSQWDYDLLRLEVGELKTLGYSTELLGFKEEELAVLLTGWESDIKVNERDGEDLSGLGVTIKITVSKEDNDKAREAIVLALNETGLSYELK